MKRSTFRLRLCIVLLIFNLLFIWGNSMLPREVSAAFSQWVKNLLFSIVHITPADPEASHGLLRKIAHFTEFACLGFLFAWLYGMLRKHLALAALCGFAAACIDETIQLFIPDRGPGIRDVLIDTAGVCTGLAVVCLYLLCKKHRMKEKKL